MALHSYTFAELKAAVTHALGKSPDSSLTSEGEIVNDALADFVNLHPWSWRRKASSLNLTADQNYVALPSDFAALDAIQMACTSGCLHPTSLQQIIDGRSSTLAVPISGTYWYAVAWTGQTSATASPTARLELWPTPAATVASAITLSYFRIIPALSGATDLPDMPPHFHRALKAFVRAHALEEDGQPEAVDAMAKAMSLIQPLMREDGTIQASLGMPRGGLDAPPWRTTAIRPGDTIEY